MSVSPRHAAGLRSLFLREDVVLQVPRTLSLRWRAVRPRRVRQRCAQRILVAHIHSLSYVPGIVLCSPRPPTAVSLATANHRLLRGVPTGTYHKSSQFQLVLRHTIHCNARRTMTDRASGEVSTHTTAHHRLQRFAGERMATLEREREFQLLLRHTIDCNFSSHCWLPAHPFQLVLRHNRRLQQANR